MTRATQLTASAIATTFIGAAIGNCHGHPYLGAFVGFAAFCGWVAVTWEVGT